MEKARRPLPDANAKPSTSEKATASQLADATKDKPSDAAKSGSTGQESLTKMAVDKATAAKEEGQKLEAKKEEKRNLTIMQKIKKEVMHYWDGTVLLATEVKISIRLAVKMAAGYELSRRENRQVRLHSRIPFNANMWINTAATDSPRSGSTSALLRLCHRTIRRVAAACRSPTLPEPTS